jgi:RiboL-PSP-HEPN
VSTTIIDKSYDDNKALIEYLSSRNELSLLRTVDDSFRKTLVLSAASLFEQRISEAIHYYCDQKSGSDTCVVSLVRNKVIKRQYHTYFDWDNRRATPFFGLLGEEIGNHLKSDAKNDPLKGAVDAFLELGYLRNVLIHQNFAGYVFDKTAEEVYGLYRSASLFVDKVVEILA